MGLREAIEVDGFHFLMPEPGAEDAVCCSRAKGDRLADDSLAQAYGTAEDRAAERGGRDAVPGTSVEHPDIRRQCCLMRYWFR
ncbi:hypothetical protein SAMN05428953_101237 [Mesorhizobium muleiense]|uniref:Uncharacterized protein n=1 Tax=Mesorhizobium muleiense TaxID=1004279 RepID=A0A1G8I274_9HYPH|nr:hypothetical protein SAMN05428953_101237 [Mesorhizobium muleiense]